MLSRSAWNWLLRKEWRELISSRSWWLFVVLMGPLTGVSFISAVRTYAEASGLGGTSAGVGEAFSPLIGIWGPTFSACEIAAAFLLPFVAIRLVAGDRQSGALKLELQQPLPALARILTKAVVLFAGWTLALAAPVAAIALWKSYGGTIYWPEVATVLLGHLFNAALAIAIASAAACIAEHPSTAAIFTLAITVGTWVLSFIAAVHGGVWERAALYTPTAMVAQFQHGLIRLDVTIIVFILAAAGFVLAATWLRIGRTTQRRAAESVAVAVISLAAIGLATFIPGSWDTSENRMNSFSRADEAALRQIARPVQIEAYLAPEDPRRADLERRAISKLRRAVPHLQVHYVSATSIGLFEQTNPHYGEIWYSIDGRRTMSRATTAEAVLESVYTVANVTPPQADEEEFRGHPLAVAPKGGPLFFYVVWPAIVVLIAVVTQRRKFRTS